jgi:hypothetical protein
MTRARALARIGRLIPSGSIGVERANDRFEADGMGLAEDRCAPKSSGGRAWDDRLIPKPGISAAGKGQYQRPC